MSARLRVDLNALARNFKTCAEAAVLAPFAQSPCFGAVVKANAYGLGIEGIAPELAKLGCEDFFVATAEEGVALRQWLPKVSIYVFEGPTAESIQRLKTAELIPVLNSVDQLALFRSTTTPQTEHKVAVHIDTGMTRLGFAPADIDAALFADLNVVLVLTHLGCADDPTASANQQQITRFCQSLESFPNVGVSVGNSAGSLNPQLMNQLAEQIGPRQLLTRPGIALYGGMPFLDDITAQAHDLQLPLPLAPVATLEAQVLQLRDVAAGTPVGYGQSYIAPQPRRLATLSIGYADGLPRLLSNQGGGYIGGHYCPLVGRVSMDLVTLDVSDARVEVGDWVEFFGANIGLSEVARMASTIDYELLVGIGARVRREWHY